LISSYDQSLILFFRVASDFKYESVFWFFLDQWQLFSFFFEFLLFLLHFVLFFLLIGLLNFLSFEFPFFFLLLHLLIELLLVFFTIENVFFLYFVFKDQNLFYLLEKLSLDLCLSFIESAAGASELFTAFFRKLFRVNVEDSQSTDCGNVFVFSSALCVNNDILVFDGLFLFLLFGCFLFLGLLEFLLDGNDIFLLKFRMIFDDFCWCEII
jgi:hypothetical protein